MDLSFKTNTPTVDQEDIPFTNTVRNKIVKVILATLRILQLVSV